MLPDTFPRYLVGNVAYDQSIQALARTAELVTIDASDTIHAFHQTGEDGNGAGHIGREEPKSHNLDIYEKLARGCVYTSCAGYRSTWTHDEGWVRRLAIQAVESRGGKFDIPRVRVQRYQSRCRSMVDLKNRHPTVHEPHNFSFMLYLAQVCHLISLGDFWKDAVSGSGQIHMGSAFEMWRDADCDSLFPQ